MPETTEIRTEKSISLARGPALLLGTVLLVAGLYFLYKQHVFPKLANFPNGQAPVEGKVLFGIFGANGWTGMLIAVGGGLLLFGAAQHLLAKTMSLIVGVALGAAAIIALVSGNVLGLAAANGWTEFGWGVAAAILLFNAAIPRGRRTVDRVDAGPVGRRRDVGTGMAVTGAAAGAGERGVANRRVPADEDADAGRAADASETERDSAPTGTQTDDAAAPHSNVERQPEPSVAGPEEGSGARRSRSFRWFPRR